MATRPALPHVLKHTVLILVNAVDWHVWTFHVLHNATPTQAMVDADRAVLRTWLATQWKFWIGNCASVREIKSVSLETSPPTKFAVDHVYPNTVITGTSPTGTPLSVALVASLRTGAVGQMPKPPSGRLFFGPFSGGSVAANGRFSGGNTAAVQGVVDNLRQNFNGVEPRGSWVVPSYWSGGTRAAPVLRPAPLALPVTHILVTDIPGTVRRRRPRQQSFVQN